MEVEKTTEQGAVILHVSGRVDSTNASSFESQVFESIDHDIAQLVFNLQHLEYISSAGLRVLLKLAKHQQQHNQKFAVCALPPDVNELFEITGFNNIIAIYADQRAALQA